MEEDADRMGWTCASLPACQPLARRPLTHSAILEGEISECVRLKISGGPADKCSFDLEDKLSFLTADIARRGKRDRKIKTEPTRDGLSGSGVESLPQRSWTRLLNLLFILDRLFMS